MKRTDDLPTGVEHALRAALRASVKYQAAGRVFDTRQAEYNTARRRKRPLPSWPGRELGAANRAARHLMKCEKALDHAIREWAISQVAS